MFGSLENGKLLVRSVTATSNGVHYDATVIATPIFESGNTGRISKISHSTIKQDGKIIDTEINNNDIEITISGELKKNFVFDATAGDFQFILRFTNSDVIKSVNSNIGVYNDGELSVNGPVSLITVDVEFLDVTGAFGNITTDVKFLPLGYCILNHENRWSICPQWEEHIAPRVTRDSCVVSVSKIFKHVMPFPIETFYMVKREAEVSITSLILNGVEASHAEAMDNGRCAYPMGKIGSGDIHVNVIYELPVVTYQDAVQFDLPYDMAWPSGRFTAREVITMNIESDCSLDRVELFNGQDWTVLDENSFDNPRFPDPLPVKVYFK